ncbi:MAG TPA: single-stranded DNA-binding protein [Mycobacterium sp.]
MTEPPDPRVPTPEEPAATMTEQKEQMKADLPDETREVDVEERVNTRVRDAQAHDDVTAISAGDAARTAGDGSPRAGMRISIAGNVAAEPTFGLTQDGRSWARLRVASHERVRDAGGQWTSTPPSYTEVVLFGRAAEDAANSLQIGDPVMVQGRPEVQAFTRRDGAPGAGLKVFATTVTWRDTESTTVGHGPATRADRRADRGVGEQDTAGHQTGPVIHHTQAHTIAVGVTRDDKDAQAALKSAGFRWSGPRAAWYLPASMDHHQRSLRVDTASRGAAIAVTDSPAPNATSAPAPASATTHDAPSASTGPAAPHADLSPDL